MWGEWVICYGEGMVTGWIQPTEEDWDIAPEGYCSVDFFTPFESSYSSKNLWLKNLWLLPSDFSIIWE
jgi:hypothetical protein